MTYTNGDTLDGRFRNGHPHGTIVYTFVSTDGRVRLAKYDRGTRIEWIAVGKKSHAKGTKKKKKAGGTDQQGPALLKSLLDGS